MGVTAQLCHRKFLQSERIAAICLVFAVIVDLSARALHFRHGSWHYLTAGPSNLQVEEVHGKLYIYSNNDGILVRINAETGTAVRSKQVQQESANYIWKSRFQPIPETNFILLSNPQQPGGVIFDAESGESIRSAEPEGSIFFVGDVLLEQHGCAEGYCALLSRLDPQTSDRLWTARARKYSWSGEVALQLDSNAFIYGLGPSIVCYDARHGNVLWRAEPLDADARRLLQVVPGRTHGSPILVEAVTGELVALDPTNGGLLFNSTHTSEMDPAVVVRSGTMALFKDGAEIFAMATGRHSRPTLFWKQPEGTAIQHLYPTEDGDVLVLTRDISESKEMLYFLSTSGALGWKQSFKPGREYTLIALSRGSAIFGFTANVAQETYDAGVLRLSLSDGRVVSETTDYTHAFYPPESEVIQEGEIPLRSTNIQPEYDMSYRMNVETGEIEERPPNTLGGLWRRRTTPIFLLDFRAGTTTPSLQFIQPLDHWTERRLPSGAVALTRPVYEPDSLLWLLIRLLEHLEEVFNGRPTDEASTEY